MLNPAVTKRQKIQTSKQSTTIYIYIYIYIRLGSSCSMLSSHPYQCTCEIRKQSIKNSFVKPFGVLTFDFALSYMDFTILINLELNLDFCILKSSPSRQTVSNAFLGLRNIDIHVCD